MRAIYRSFRSRQLITLAIVLFVLFGVAFATIGSWRHIQTGTEFQEQRPVIVLDPGHGGVDPGAIGTNGAEEKDINLSIALCLRDILTANGWEVIMTRDEDIAINDPQYKKISQVKTSDLKKRLQIFEEHPEAIAITIHQNHFTQERYNGAQMFYGRKNPESQLIAEAIQTAFRENLQPENSRAIKRSTSDVYILHNATVPAVLVECGFLSNASECALLCDEEYQQKTAFTIYCGLLEYCRQKAEKTLT